MTQKTNADDQARAAPVRSASVLLILAALAALGPLSTDAYVPGLPQLAEDLHSLPSTAQLTVTTCLIGLAVGQLVAGPMSDALGRRTPLLLGLAVYTAAGLACAIAPNIGTLVVFRAIQGGGGAFGLVIAYAYVRDLHQGKAAARYLSLMLLVTGLAPVLAPLVGAQILRFSGWREIFVALAALCAAVLVACIRALPESLPAHRRRPGGLRATGSVYVRLLKDRALVGYALTNASVFSAMFAYIAGSPFVLEHIYRLTPQQYSLVFAVNASGLVAAAHASGRLVRRLGPLFLLGGGVIGSVAGGGAVLLVVITNAGLWPLLAALFTVITSVGLVLPNAPALALESHGSHAGAASALLGFTQFLFGGLAAPLVGVLGSGSALPMAAAMAGLAVTASIMLIALVRPTTPLPLAICPRS
ncbi:multidrug effflux MFS transporter [Streptantibioticus ferralitis]|uniref:Multidrug effflux MFS transporter n=1 Tax=Streptantibioticus ferralitis TaxID=236510 RepID=A0ABT5ZB98_9ACTN|nr:multidrug effflux MFS transporter [Streptantibioticus ferralitis]MDF2261119.1 multidrug effflux MFS transporter [Streptantibioticus ferralitis]